MKRALRVLADQMPEANAVGGGGSPLELTTQSGERPRMAHSTILEGTTIRAHGIRPTGRSEFAAFVDGVQRSEVCYYLPGGVPIVLGTVAAVVQERRDRRMRTWRREVERSVYLPRAWAPVAMQLVGATGVRCVDTSEGPPGNDEAPPHPLEMLTRAVHCVQEDRERLEGSLATAWCRERRLPLFVDGGIGGDAELASAPSAVGVVKSHRTLYADGEALRAVLSLREGERSSVVRIEGRRRRAVASWYLRVRDPKGHDPLWGLVRVEIAEGADAIRRADEISRWIVAERAPLALPDARWDKMAYGVRVCEEYLRSIS